MQTPRVFLTAEWRWLAMLNWPCPEELLAPHLPRGLELERWQGQPYVSVVGFMFRDTRLRGWAIPLHRHFPELNLRFYLRQGDDPATRGVAFIREVVPLPAVSFVARTVYNENYVTCPMRQELSLAGDQLASGSRVSYSWKHRGRWNSVSAVAAGAPAQPDPGTAEHFFTENYWGYTRLRNGSTARYRVEHPPWNIWPAGNVNWDCDASAMYGPQWRDVLGQPPESAYAIEGSAVKVYDGAHLAEPAQRPALAR